MWFRVFGVGDELPDPAELLKHLDGMGLKVEGRFKSDDLGWFHCDLVLPGDDRSLVLERYMADEDDIRHELSAWAAWLETVENNSYSLKLMEQMIRTKQLFTLDCPRDRAEEERVEKLCAGLCRYLAQQTQGIYQVDRQGFFAPNGKLLVRETS